MSSDVSIRAPESMFHYRNQPFYLCAARLMDPFNENRVSLALSSCYKKFDGRFAVSLKRYYIFRVKRRINYNHIF